MLLAIAMHQVFMSGIYYMFCCIEVIVFLVSYHINLCRVMKMEFGKEYYS